MRTGRGGRSREPLSRRIPRARTIATLLLVAALLTPVGVVMMVPLLMGTALGAGPGACRPAGVSAADVHHHQMTGARGGDRMVVHSTSGEAVPLDPAQLANAAAMVTAVRERGASDRAALVMLMTGLQESRLRNLANPGAVPESMNFPHDGVGDDHDSIGVLQQRPSMSWGTVAELMDPGYAARAFLGGPDGPNAGTPPGLLDLDAWEHDDPGVAAQRVQASAFPDAYEQWLGAAIEVLDRVGDAPGHCPRPATSGDGAYPLSEPAPITDGVGPRPCRVGGPGGCASSTWHPALDFGAACGVPVVAARPGTVTAASDYWVSVTTDDGTVISYLHMFASDVTVALGDVVEAGARLGAVGNAGPSTGCHLDFRVNTIATTDPDVGSLPHVGDASVAPGFVDPVAYMALYGVDLLTGETA
ncbi:hypothetical protein GCM10011490_19610 [Pseudoclavibacter endophyticus]|uniref:M23 family metallopeptidase n=1 Tax=Pseudoclavibacter endophyticus TaxID=1778590 RepID=A0A6H9WPV4_9MICO|nr:M23 family metallopeptidase [Pseudoclavibacter endophyticus]KAB1648025.1 M23 family metallopeptidase [Pseudoclavibacter endophyticus]GGA69125.1 hypothetical protein GCM10011490_19610 [Pseudoclavibacter endophyticus]